MEAPTIVSLSELLHRSSPLTGASSLTLSSSSSSSSTFSISSHINPISSVPSTDSASDRNPTPRLLTSLNHPTLLIGTLTLPADGKCSVSGSMSCGCFSFSDDTSRVFCTVLDFDLKLIGKRIYVLSWNLIPFKSCGSGFLEIIRWSLFDSAGEIGRCSSNSYGFLPLSFGDSSIEGEQLKAGSCVTGRVESVSPVSIVPCTIQNRKDQTSSIQNSTGSRNLGGFLAELMVCECKLCGSKSSLLSAHDSLRERNCHSFEVTVMVLFLGRASSWHAVVSRLLGNVVCVTGLKKKLVFIGEKDSYLMFVTMEKAALHTLVLIPDGLSLERTVIKGGGELGSYTGTVTGVYMQSMVVELDEKVWLLLTDQLLAPPHALRIGALVSIRNVHFVHPKFSWTKILLLGACFKTSISVRSYSPLETQCHIRSHKQSLLSKFLESLVFSARFWVLLTISCFKKKFAGIFSGKRILGSKHNEGLVQMYAKSCLPSCMFQQRHGAFMEFCKHNQHGCGCEPNYNHLKLVVPMSNFISHCEAIWVTLLLQRQNDTQAVGKNDLLSCGGISNCRLIRRIFTSEELGLLLMGTLQVSSSSGRLQLIDATGSIDAVIPDISSNLDASILYEVRHYSVVIEGFPAEVGTSSLLKSEETLSCRSIFHHSLLESNIKPSAIYVHFHLKDAVCLNVRLSLPCMDWIDTPNGFENGCFHLLAVTHKFSSATHNLLGDPLTVKSSLFVEAIILPWDLFLPVASSYAEGTEVTQDDVGKNLERVHGKNYSENLCRKKARLTCESRPALVTDVKDDLGAADDGSYGSVSNCLSQYKIFSGNQKSNNVTSSHEIRCQVLFRNFNDKRSAKQGILLRADCNVINGVIGEAIGQKTLLEFKPEIFSNYQLLKVGGYYIMKCCKDDFLHNLVGRDFVSCSKTLVTSQTQLWGLSFSCDEVPSICGLREDHFSITSVKNDGAPCKSSPNELFFQRCPSQTPEVFSDINLHLSADALDLLNLDSVLLDGGKPFCVSGHTDIGSTCIGDVMAGLMQSSGTTDTECRLPQGNLVSFCGDILDVHDFNCCFFDTKSPLSYDGFGDVHQSRLFQGLFSSICIHVSEDHHIVRVRGTLIKDSYPIGIGSGVHATFHRVLVLGKHEFLLTPVSLIVINKIKEVCHDNNHWCSCPLYGSDFLNDELLDMASRLFSELTQYLENDPMQFCCRVVAIHILVLEKQKDKFEKSWARKQSQAHAINIPFASFILDDGSSPCCCWASSEVAAILLGLHKLFPAKDFHKNNWSLKTNRSNKTDRSVDYFLQNILKTHERISVKNNGSMFDSANQDLVFSVKSDNVFSCSDENFLKLIILNACCGTILNIKGSVMDSNAIEQLEKVVEVSTAVKAMCNIWAMDVKYVDPRLEARNLIEELTR